MVNSFGNIVRICLMLFLFLGGQVDLESPYDPKLGRIGARQIPGVKARFVSFSPGKPAPLILHNTKRW
jgi:hypothetical protein